jgi:HAD superfamily hydrolase (TIGR01509 family)
MPQIPMPISKAVIFDCDGTLVDSEFIGNRVLSESMSELGLDLSTEECIARFTGGKMADCLSELESDLGKPLPEGFTEILRARIAKAFQLDLQAFVGVEKVLKRLKVPICVASSGPIEKIELSLTHTNLIQYFQDRIFSSYEIGIWKPDPGLFFHAAKKMGIAPQNCLVVEDSHPGFQAAQAAGMQLLKFQPNPAAYLNLICDEASVFHSYSEFPFSLVEYDHLEA